MLCWLKCWCFQSPSSFLGESWFSQLRLHTPPLMSKTGVVRSFNVSSVTERGRMDHSSECWHETFKHSNYFLHISSTPQPVWPFSLKPTKKDNSVSGCCLKNLLFRDFPGQYHEKPVQHSSSPAWCHHTQPITWPFLSDWNFDSVFAVI